MNWLLIWVHLIALGVWLGETVFFGAVVAPALFGGLSREEAGAVTALIFPGYYAVGYVCGTLLVVSALALWQRSRPAGGVWLIAAVVSGVILAACLYAGLIVLPEADTLRPLLHDSATEGAVRERFDALHRLAVQLNFAVLLGTLLLAGMVAARLSSGMLPRSRRRRPLSRYSSDPLL